MKIGIIIEHCSAQRASRYVLDTSKYFTKKGHEVHIFANKFDTIDNEKIIFHKIPAVSSNFYIKETSLTLLATILLKFHSFDVTLAQPTRYFSPDVAEMQFVYKAWADYKKQGNLPLFAQDVLLPLVEGYNIKKAKGIIALSNVVKSEVIKYYNVPKEKIHVVYSGINLQEFPLRDKAIFARETDKKYNISPDDLVLIFVGSPFIRKGLWNLIEAFKKIKNRNTKLIVIGGKGDDPTPYKNLAIKLGIEKNIIFVESTKEPYKYFSAADIFVLPTLYEPFGLVILEAMASGLPVITSKLAGAAELIDDGKDGFLLEDPKSSVEMAEKLNYLLEKEELRKRIGKEARKKAEQYTWERTADGMIKILEETARM